MIKRISDERARIDGYKLSVGGAEFFNNRAYDEDFEWLILAYLAEILSSIGRQAPEYAQKLEPPNPDFQTYLALGIAFQRIEVTEVLRPGYRRGKFHRELAKSSQRFYDIPAPHPKPSHIRLVRGFSYTMTCPTQSFQTTHLGTSVFLAELGSWTYESDTTCDITQSAYESIYVVDASGVGAVRLHPHWDVVRESPFLR